MDVELEIGTKVKINGHICEVIKSRKCSSCEVHKVTKGSKNYNGSDMQCGTKNNCNTSKFACSKDVRSDGVNIIFKRVE